jgi:hypothetical protein
MRRLSMGDDRADQIISSVIWSLQEVFPGTRITIMVRDPRDHESEVFGTSDDLDEVEKCVNRMIDRQTEGRWVL